MFSTLRENRRVIDALRQAGALLIRHRHAPTRRHQAHVAQEGHHVRHSAPLLMVERVKSYV